MIEFYLLDTNILLNSEVFMKIYFGIVVSLIFVSTVTHAQALPDRIECSHASSNYKLVLLLKSPQLPDGYTAFGLKNGPSLVFKVASQAFKDGDNILKFIESPATVNSKEVNLNLQSKVATLSHFHLTDLADGSDFSCQF